MQILITINIILAVLFVLCYAFQIFYVFVPYIKKMPGHKETKLHKYAVIVCARNEESVIPDLVASIKSQDYPNDLIDIVLVADNCTDRTACVGRDLGLIVYERFNDKEIGKGYALDYGLSRLDEDYGDDFYDAFIVFDADNILTENFITEVNKTFSDGYDVVTTYRNAKNYGDSWLSAGSGLWFIREAKYLNGSRMRIGACPQVSGTGFLFSNNVKKENGGWPFHTMTEDYEFTCHSVIKGKKFGYCENARFYDEQVSGFKQAWNQRLRWCKGGLQSFVKYGPALLKCLFSKKVVAAYDMVMSIAPGYFISIAVCLVNIIGGIILTAAGTSPFLAFLPFILIVFGAYIFVLMQSVVATVSEWKYIKANNYKKILYMFTFPLYIMTFVPIAFVAIFKKSVQWTPIRHNSVDEKSADEMSKRHEE